MEMTNKKYTATSDTIQMLNSRKEKKMETLNVVMAIEGNLLVVGAFVWFIAKRDKK